MKILIIKTGAAGDVVRTTTLLNTLQGEVDWVVSKSNSVFLEGAPQVRKIILEEDFPDAKLPYYDIVLNLEDSRQITSKLKDTAFDELVGVYERRDGKLDYTENSRIWFDMSLISRFGKKKADQLKYRNRLSYQELLFSMLGKDFSGEQCFLPSVEHSSLFGDVALAPRAGKRWPMKNWAYYDDLKQYLEHEGFIVNILPERESIEQHIADIRNHAFLVSGDSLPMHIALGFQLKVLTIFQCTSPYEIYGYNSQIKLISPKLKEYFYRTDFDERAVKAVTLEQAKLNFLKLTEIPKAHGWT